MQRTSNGDMQTWYHIRTMWERCTRVCKHWRTVCWWPPLFCYYMIRCRREGVRYSIMDSGFTVRFFNQRSPWKRGPTLSFTYDNQFLVLALQTDKPRCRNRERMKLSYSLIHNTLLWPRYYHDEQCQGFVMRGDHPTKSNYNNERQFARFLFTSEVLVPLFEYALRRVRQVVETDHTLTLHETTFFIDEWRTTHQTKPPG